MMCNNSSTPRCKHPSATHQTAGQTAPQLPSDAVNEAATTNAGTAASAAPRVSFEDHLNAKTASENCSNAAAEASPEMQRHTNASYVSESPSMAAVGMRQKQYTLDTLDEALGPESDVGLMPDRDHLHDQIEWDVGVYDTLIHLKALQIKEQIAMDRRHEEAARKLKQTRASSARTTKLLTGLIDRVERVAGAAASRLTSRLSSQGPAAAPSADASDGTQGSKKKGVAFDEENPQKLLDDHEEDEDAEDSGGAQETGASGAPTMSSKAARMLMGTISNATGGAFSNETRDTSRRSLFEDLADTAEMSRPRWFIVNPQSYKYQVWHFFTNVAVFLICVLEPVRIGRILSDSSTLNPILSYCDVQMILDLFAHFVLAYDDELRDIMVTAPKHIIPRYIKGYFVLDLLIALPWNTILGSSNPSFEISLVRDCLRTSKLIASHRMLSDRGENGKAPDRRIFSPSLITLLKMMMTILFVWHWIACLYWSLSLYSHETQDPRILAATDTWTPPMNVLLSPSNMTHYRYAYAMTWAISVTTGGSFPTPCTMLQLLFGNGVSIVGFLLMSLVIGSATTALSDLQAQSSEISMRLQHIDRYMRYKRLPHQIRRRVVSYYRFQYTSLNAIDENEVLVGLPRALRMQMQLILHRPIFVQLPLFWLCSEEEILLITQRLRHVVIMPGEMIIKEDRLGPGLFMLMKGAVETLRNDQLVVVLLAVAAFGENALRGTPSNCSIRALRFCETNVLLREDFAVIEKMNPVVRRWLDVYILERDRKLQDPRIRRQSQETKCASIKSNNCQTSWRDNSADFLSRNSRRRGVGIRLVAQVQAGLGVMRRQQERRRRQTRARRTFTEAADRQVKQQRVLSVVNFLRARRARNVPDTNVTAHPQQTQDVIAPLTSDPLVDRFSASHIAHMQGLSNHRKLSVIGSMAKESNTESDRSTPDREHAAPSAPPSAPQPSLGRLTRRSMAMHEAHHKPASKKAVPRASERSTNTRLFEDDPVNTPMAGTPDMRNLLGASLETKAYKSGRRDSTCAALNYTGFENGLGGSENDQDATWRRSAAIVANFKQHESPAQATKPKLHAENTQLLSLDERLDRNEQRARKARHDKHRSRDGSKERNRRSPEPNTQSKPPSDKSPFSA